MSNHANALHMLERMSELSAHMVSAARDNDWDRLVELEQDVSSLRDRMAANDRQAVALTAAQRARKVMLIQQILADDAEVRRHVEPWMEHVRVFLGRVSASAGNGVRRPQASNDASA